ncbi:MAG: hypothetical protein AAF392_03035 [Bacteroidota bacterium]
MDKHMQPMSKPYLQGIQHICAFIAVFLLNFPTAIGVTGLQIPSLTSEKVATQDPIEVELQELADLIEKIRPLIVLEGSACEDLKELVADSQTQEACMGWDSDEDISQQMDKLEVKDEEDKDVDMSMEGILEPIGRKYFPKWLQQVKNYSRTHQDRKWNDNYVDAKDASPTKLAKDAKLIQEAMKGDKSHTTILCVALRDRHGHIKKFAFCNSAIMPSSCRDKAESLGYAVIKAEQSHAEGQFLQFLHKRARINPGLYTHIVAMGCSKLHCPECDLVLQLVLGSNYKAISAAIGAVTEDITQLEIQEEHEPADDNFTITRNASIHCTIQSGEGAARKDLSEKFYMPDGLKELIEQQTEPRCRLQVIGNSRYSKSKKRR